MSVISVEKNAPSQILEIQSNSISHAISSSLGGRYHSTSVHLPTSKRLSWPILAFLTLIGL